MGMMLRGVTGKRRHSPVRAVMRVCDLGLGTRGLGPAGFGLLVNGTTMFGFGPSIFSVCTGMFYFLSQTIHMDSGRKLLNVKIWKKGCAIQRKPLYIFDTCPINAGMIMYSGSYSHCTQRCKPKWQVRKTVPLDNIVSACSFHFSSSISMYPRYNP